MMIPSFERKVRARPLSLPVTATNIYKTRKVRKARVKREKLRRKREKGRLEDVQSVLALWRFAHHGQQFGSDV